MNLQAKMGVYPFMFGTASDFEPIVEEMVQVSRLSSAVDQFTDFLSRKT